jgi:hypothetical protein
MDQLGGQGNGLAFFAGPTAPIQNHELYILYSTQQFSAINLAEVKARIQNAYASAEAAPIINYLQWVLKVGTDTA